MTMAKMRKPTEAQRRALVWLIDATPHGVELWHDAKQIEREATWRACANAGWVDLEPLAAGEPIARVKITDAGRRWADPFIRGRAEAAAIIEQIKRDAHSSYYWEHATRDLPREPAWKGSES